MSARDSSGRRTTAARYRVVVEGNLGPRFRQAFSELEIDPVGGDTALEGEMADQAQLRGVLDRVAALNLTLLSVSRLEDERVALHRSPG